MFLGFCYSVPTLPAENHPPVRRAASPQRMPPQPPVHPRADQSHVMRRDLQVLVTKGVPHHRRFRPALGVLDREGVP